MAVKRKFVEEVDETPSYSAKQLKLVPFPSSDLDTDVAMSDSPVEDDDSIFHSRLTSCASMASSISTDSDSSSSPYYPTFELYPTSDSPSRMSSPVGLMQPTHGGSAFAHLSLNCTQIPKLRVACEAGPNGQRSMWAMCEECGAINMIES